MDGVYTAQFDLEAMNVCAWIYVRSRTWTVDYQIVIVVTTKFFLKPIHILQQVPSNAGSRHRQHDFLGKLSGVSTYSLEAIHKTTIRTHAHLAHDIV
jgi:hypothetical protein